ncbi:hypothetical protein OH687_39080 (plasmid) [Burkholderia anthina]|nr:hypothetical protein OH687_39080 [Burkholderia anthina]
MPERIHITDAMPIMAVGKLSKTEDRFPFSFSNQAKVKYHRF